MMMGGKTLVGIDGNTALMCSVRLPEGSDHRYEVSGSGSVTVWNQEKRKYVEGEEVRLVRDA
jgi:hypothetical protein